MNNKNNFALSIEGQSRSNPPADYSLTGSRSAAAFDVSQNLRDVVHQSISIVTAPPSEALLYSAAAALQRQAKAIETETDEEWADRLSKVFFEGLNGRS